MLAAIRIEGRIRCKRKEAKEVFSAYIIICQFSHFFIYQKLTNVVCVSDVGFCAWVDVNTLIMMAGPGWYD